MGGGCLPQPRWAVCATGAGAHPGQTSREGEKDIGGRPGQRVEDQGTWASRTQKHNEAGYGRPVDRGVWTAKTVKRPRQQPAHPQCTNYWAPLTRKRHAMPHSARPQHTNYWAPRTRKRHQQEHRPQRPTESSDPTQHAKGRTGDCPGPCKEATTRRNVTRGGGGGVLHDSGTSMQCWRCSVTVGSGSPISGRFASSLFSHVLRRQSAVEAGMWRPSRHLLPNKNCPCILCRSRQEKAEQKVAPEYGGRPQCVHNCIEERGDTHPCSHPVRILCNQPFKDDGFSVIGHTAHFIVGPGRSFGTEIFFLILLRTALKDRPKGPSTANYQPPPTANRQLPPTASGDQPPTANHC